MKKNLILLILGLFLAQGFVFAQDETAIPADEATAIETQEEQAAEEVLKPVFGGKYLYSAQSNTLYDKDLQEVAKLESSNFTLSDYEEEIVAYYDEEKITVKTLDGFEICEFEAPAKGARVSKYLLDRYVIYRLDGKYGWYDTKKKELRENIYDNISTDRSTWFSPISAQKVLNYELDGKTYNRYEKGLIAKRIALFPVEFPAAIVRDAGKVAGIILTCGGVYMIPEYWGVNWLMAQADKKN